MRVYVGAFLRQAEDILEIAAAGRDPAQTIILIDRQGGMRILDAAGWSLPALAAEFGAAAVYRVERRAGSVQVEGWDGAQRCLLESPRAHPTMLQLPPRATAGVNERSPQVRNS